MLKVTDLIESKELDSRAMGRVLGGSTLALVFEPQRPRLPLIDFSTGITNKVADVSQAFNFGFAQANEGAVTNNQQILGGNGASGSPVHQSQTQSNWMDVHGVGNVSVG
jgi:hypothetical protein